MSELGTFKWVFERPVNATWDLPVTKTVMQSPERLERVVAVVGPPGGKGDPGEAKLTTTDW